MIPSGRPTRWLRSRDGVEWLGVALLGAVLLFANLGDRALWYDEAQTALIARQILEHGRPVFDLAGNLPTDRADRADFDSDGLFIWNTWLPYYLVAGSFGMFGKSELAARLPLALAGLLSLLVAYGLGRRLLTGVPHGGPIAAALLLTCVPLLLHLRQCRYYALVVLGTLGMVWGYRGLVGGARWGWPLLCGAALVCFYSFFVVAAVNLTGFWVHACWRERRAGVLRGLALATGVFLLFAAPTAWYLHLWYRPSQEPLTLYRFTSSLWLFLLWTNGFVFPLAIPVLVAVLRQASGRWLLSGAYLAFLWGAAAKGEPLRLLLLVALLVLLGRFVFLHLSEPESGERSGEDSSSREGFDLIAILVSVHVLSMALIAPFPFYRYLVAVVPLILLAAAGLLGDLFSRSRALASTLLILLVTTNLLGAAPLKLFEWLVGPDDAERPAYSVIPREIWRWTEFRSDLAAFAAELSHHVSDPEEAIASYLEAHASPGQAVKTSYEDVSLMYYLPWLRVISRWDGGGGLPDWIIVRPPYPLVQSDEFRAAIRQARFVEETVPTGNLVWANRPDPLFHRYRTDRDAPRLRVLRRVPGEGWP
jgi:4-amino-4-deoxy-L-arabinose transferase-like glycosyltransferase